MGRNYDNWERLVEAVMRREQWRNLSLESSRSASTISFDSDFSSSSSFRHDEDAYSTPSPFTVLHPEALRLKLAQVAGDGTPSRRAKAPTKRRNLWKGLSVFSNFYSKKDYGKEEREPKWANGKRTFHGHEPRKSYNLKDSSRIAEEARRKAEIERLQELHTLKGHIKALVKEKGLDGDSIHHYYTI